MSDNAVKPWPDILTARKQEILNLLILRDGEGPREPTDPIRRREEPYPLGSSVGGWKAANRRRY